MEQDHIPPSQIAEGCGRINNIQRNLPPGLAVFHPKSSLTSDVLRRQENGPVGVAQPVVMQLHVPLVGSNVVAPHFLQSSKELRDWLVNVELTEEEIYKY